MNRRLGCGLKTFKVGLDDEHTLDFRQYYSAETKEQFESDARATCKRVIGGRHKKEKDVELCFIESYSITNGTVFGLCARTKRQRCYLSSLYLKLARREWLSNDDEYGGRVFEWISGEPMSRDTLSWAGGRTLGDVSGAAFGVIAHELEHCFGPNHHRTDDDERERKGHLMGLGMRGFRGVFRPDLTTDRCVLSRQDAEHLDDSPFFTIRADLTPKGSHYLAR